MAFRRGEVFLQFAPLALFNLSCLICFAAGLCLPGRLDNDGGPGADSHRVPEVFGHAAPLVIGKNAEKRSVILVEADVDDGILQSGVSVTTAGTAVFYHDASVVLRPPAGGLEVYPKATKSPHGKNKNEWYQISP